MTSKEIEPIWYNDISILAKNTNKLWPKPKMSLNEQINALTRLILAITILGYVITNNNMYLITGIFFVILIGVLGYAKKNKMIKYDINANVNGSGFLNYLKNITPTREGFVANMDSKSVEEHIKQTYETQKQVVTSTGNKAFETPSSKNPFSNVLLTEIHDNPHRKSAPPAYLKSVEEEINEKTKELIKNENPEIKDIDQRLFTEVGDNFTFDRGMRQFYSMPNTQVVNDQKGFAEFCYGTTISCKEGDEQACERNAFRYRPGY